MKNILIYYNINNIKPIGGPSGYLFNLYEGLKLNNNINGIKIDFLDEPVSNGKEKINKVRRLPRHLAQVIIDNYTYYKYKHILNNEYEIKNFEFYDAIHFHSTIDLYKCRKALENYKGKVILSTHCPKAQHMEICEDYVSGAFWKKHKIAMTRFKEFDRFAFNRADVIIFPCKEALEPYFSSWNEFADILKRNENKFKYILSGIKKVYAKEEKDVIRKKYGIPREAMVISYVGRHNETKGYDLLQAIFHKTKDVYFLIAGDCQGVDYPKDRRWIEVGWTNDPYSIVGASDCFILPNKQTYFDLVLLEVLSLGKVVLLSETGGNKHFHKYGLDSICFFNDVNEAYNQIIKLSSFTSEKLTRMGKKNEVLFDEKFNCKKFAENYVQLINDIL